MKAALTALALVAANLPAQSPDPILARHQMQAVDGALEAEVERLLNQPLTQESVLRLAALHSPRVKATLSVLNLAEADLVQAGLLPNPTLSLGFQRGNGSRTSAFSFSQELVGLFTRGLRKQVASRQVDGARLQVAAELMAFEAALKTAFVTVQATQQETAVRRRILELSDAGLELARRQRSAGNISQLTLDTQVAAEAQLRLDLTRSEVRETAAREAMNRLLGLSGPQTRWTLAEALPPLPPSDPDPSGLESFAVAHRFDLALARANGEVVEAALRLARSTRYFASVSVGTSSEKESGAARMTGPFIELELPLFNRKQGEIVRLAAQASQTEASLTALAVDVRSQTREAIARLAAARAIAAYFRDTLVPLRQRVVDESQLHYNAMVLGVYDLIRAQQDRNETAKGYLEALQDYWIARIELEHTLGDALPPTSEEISR